jgi:NAD(P)-dependent dehydrogenase (short-subunit alcohol dehydrogenase family)
MKNPMDMTGCRVLVTGASSGIGRATAKLLAELGCQVVLAARNVDRLQAARAEMPGDGHLVKSVDLSKVESIDSWLRKVVEVVGPLTGLVHSAGIHRILPIRFEKPSIDDPLWRINYHAAVALVQAFRKPSIHSGNSSVVLVSSVMGFVGQAGVSAYCASKGALQAFCRGAALEFAQENIRVNCVAPGHVHTMMITEVQNSLTKEQFNAIEGRHPLGIGKPEDVANAIVFLLAGTGRWITGSTLVVDGGYTIH